MSQIRKWVWTWWNNHSTLDFKERISERLRKNLWRSLILTYSFPHFWVRFFDLTSQKRKFPKFYICQKFCFSTITSLPLTIYCLKIFCCWYKNLKHAIILSQKSWNYQKTPNTLIFSNKNSHRNLIPMSSWTKFSTNIERKVF